MPVLCAQGRARCLQDLERFGVFTLDVVQISKVVIDNRGKPGLPGFIGELLCQSVIVDCLGCAIQACQRDSAIHMDRGQRLMIPNLAKQCGRPI